MISPYVYPILKNTKIPRRTELFYHKKKSKLTKDKIIEVIAEVYELDKDFYAIKKRKKDLVDARRILSKLLVFQLGWTKVASAKLMNNDHTSIIHCIKSFDNLYEVDENFKHMADTVFYKLQESI
jgi:chromosomal replication initiation ATPase DnaA